MIFKKHASPVLVRYILIFLIMAGIYFVMLPTGVTHAKTITVTTTADTIAADGFCSLREAIRAANLNTAVNECTRGSNSQTDTITLANGAHYDLTITSTKEDASLNGDLDIVNDLPAIDLIIKVADSGMATIDASGVVDRVLQVLYDAKVLIYNVTFYGGNFDPNKLSYGGGIYNEGTLILDKCKVSKNSAYWGGGIYNKDTLVIKNDSLIGGKGMGNSGSRDGSGIYNDGGTIMVYASTISSNSRSNFGGGIYNGGTLTLDESTVINNSAHIGGGISNTGVLTIRKGSIIGKVGEGNKADSGGGIHNYPGTVIVNASTVSGNMATSSGGGIANAGTLTLDASTVSANSANLRGGGIYNHNGTLTIKNGSTIGGTGTGNMAAYGGGIENSTQSIATIKDSTISANTATKYGGGIDNLFGKIIVIRSRLLSNNSSNNGGAIFNLTNSIDSISITGSCIVNNSHVAFYSSSFTQPKLIGTGNWWGSSTGPGPVGPGIGDTVDDNVVTVGFLKSPILGCPWVKRSAITANKNFGNQLIPLNVLTTNLTITLVNPNIIPIRDIRFADLLPSGLDITAAEPLQCSGNVNISLTSRIAFSGGSLEANDNLPGGPDECSIIVMVKGIAIGTQTNTSFAVTRAGLPAGYSNPTSIDVVPVRSLRYRSSGVNDGWVLESSESSRVGGLYNATDTTIRLGDDEADRQYRSLLSFDTSSLPDNSVIISVVLKIKKQGLIGSDPFMDHKELVVDIHNPYFGAELALVAGDFQAACDSPAAGTIESIPNSDWYSVTPHSPAYPDTFINKTGTTQFRLRFQQDDDNDNVADYMTFYSGNSGKSTDQPLLIIGYFVP